MDWRSPSGTGCSVGGPSIYRIVVEGDLEESFSDRLAGMSIRVSHGAPRGAITVLEGRILDQAQLVGVLNALYGLRLPILELGVLPDDVPSAPVARTES